MDKVKITGKIMACNIQLFYPQEIYDHIFYLDSDITIKIKSSELFDDIEIYDKVEATGILFEGTLQAGSIKVIKKYVPPQKKIGDFLK